MMIKKTPPVVDESITKFATRTFVELHEAIVIQELGAAKGDVEAIHNMRVAVRRLRVALGNFSVCLPVEDRRRLREGLEHLADALGGVRDFDVLIEALHRKLSLRPLADRYAIKSMIQRLKARRRRRMKDLTGYLSSDEFIGFKREFSHGGSTDNPEKNRLKGIEHGQAA